MRIVVTEAGGLVCDAEIDVGSRKVASLMLDDEAQADTLKGLAVLSGCLEAVLRLEFEARAVATTPGSMRRATTSTTIQARPDVPACEGGCE